MLTPEYLDHLPDELLELYYKFEESVIRDIARRLAKFDLLNVKTKDLAATTWQMQRLTESGALYEHVLRELAKITGQSEVILRNTFQKAGVTAVKYDDAVYRAAGLSPKPLNLSPAMNQLLKTMLTLTNGTVRNLTNTTAITAQALFEDAADLAFMQIATGAFDYNTAIRQAVISIADKGLSTINYLGKEEKLDVAVRRAVLTGVNQAAMKMQWERAEEMNCDLVETSAHIGARNKGTGPMNHESWQGRVFSRSGKNDKYPDFVSTTGYGTGEGLGGWNCRHNWYPFFEGISRRNYSDQQLTEMADKKVSYNGKELSVYEGTQIQRGIERKIREWKRRAAAIEGSGLNDPDTLAELGKANNKVKEWQSEMREFIKETGLSRDRIREQIQNPKKTIGLSFLSGDSHLKTIAEARQLGESENGWEKNKKILIDDYLPKYKLKDDVDETIGFWGGPEPSFNARVSGKTENILEMTKAWGKNYNQQAMALLLPNPNGTGGRLVWDFGRELSDLEMDLFFKNLQMVNEEFAKLNPDSGDYFGITSKSSRVIEHWFNDEPHSIVAKQIINKALELSFLPVDANIEKGFEFKLLFAGDDY